MNLPIKYRPVFAEHVSTRLGCQVQTKAQERISDSAVPVRPIDVRQSLGHQRPAQPRPVYDIAAVIVAGDEHTLERILHGVTEAGSDLRIKSRILVQRGRQQKRPEELAGSLACHRGPISLGVSVPSLSVAGWRVSRLANR